MEETNDDDDKRPFNPCKRLMANGKYFVPNLTRYHKSTAHYDTMDVGALG